MQSGDVITSFNNAPVLNLPSFRLTVASSDPGHEFKLSYWRDGKKHREDGPAVIERYADGTVWESHWRDGKEHRED